MLATIQTQWYCFVHSGANVGVLLIEDKEERREADRAVRIKQVEKCLFLT